MADLFTSAKSVLRRADHHIADLKKAVGVFTPDKPYTYRVEKDSKTGKYLHKAVFSEGFSDDLSCIMFDAVNNLRSCLDQITNAVQRKHTGGVVNYSSFPFAADLAGWPQAIKGLKKVPPEISALFERFKPYKGGNNALWALNYIANVKKHALLIPAGFGAAQVTMPMAFGTPEWDPRPFNASKNEITLFISRHQDLSPYIEFTYSIVISHSEPIIDGQEPVPLLNAMRSEVVRVMAETEAECSRIGLT